MGSTILYYGPGARQAALNQAISLGVLLAEPFGDAGLKVEEAREIVELLQSAPISERPGVVVVGPLDNVATSKSSDALLKTLEEPSPYVLAVLWAEDLGGVPPTIRSRCTDRFAPLGPTDPEDEDESIPRFSWDLVKAYLESDYASIVELVEVCTAKESKDDKKQRKLNLLLVSLADVLSQDLNDPRKLNLWERLREVTQSINPSSLEIIAALIGEN